MARFVPGTLTEQVVASEAEADMDLNSEVFEVTEDEFQDKITRASTPGSADIISQQESEQGTKFLAHTMRPYPETVHLVGNKFRSNAG